MNVFILGLVAALIFTTSARAASNVVEKVTGASVPLVSTNDPVEKDYQRVLEEDDTAQAEVEKWVRDAESFAEKGAADPRSTLKLRINQRLDQVQTAYKNFLSLHPDHVRGRIAFGSFLNERGDEIGAFEQWEKARQIDPKNPAAWNNVALYYGHRGPIKKAFECFEKALELKPDEPVYYQNLATHVYLFRKDAQEYYHITESEVFDKSLELYRKAVKLDPRNFILATDYAESFYGTNPPRYKEGLVAWQGALRIARDDVEREGVYIHLARIEIKLGKFDDARKHLDAVTNEMYATTKKKLVRNLDEAAGASTNRPADSLNVEKQSNP